MLVFRSLVVGLLGGIFLLNVHHLHGHMHELADAHACSHATRGPPPRVRSHVRSHHEPARSRLPQPRAHTAPVTSGMVVVDTTRAALDRLAGDRALLSHARLIPRIGNGQPDGLTLYNIAPGSLFAVLGMRDGDTLLSINNRSVITPTSALLHMPDASDFLDISLERHGAPMRIVVLIHG